MTKEYYLVEVNRPDGVSVTALRRYIQDSIHVWAQGSSPEDPLFGWFYRRGNLPKVTRVKSGQQVDRIIAR